MRKWDSDEIRSSSKTSSNHFIVFYTSSPSFSPSQIVCFVAGSDSQLIVEIFHFLSCFQQTPSNARVKSIETFDTVRKCRKYRFSLFHFLDAVKLSAQSSGHLHFTRQHESQLEKIIENCRRANLPLLFKTRRTLFFSLRKFHLSFSLQDLYILHSFITMAIFINIQCANFSLPFSCFFFLIFIAISPRSSKSLSFAPLLLLLVAFIFIEPCHQCRQRLYYPIVILCCPSSTSTASPNRPRAGPSDSVVGVLGRAYASPLIDLSFDSAAGHRWLWLFVTHFARRLWCRRTMANYCSDDVGVYMCLKDCEKHSRPDSSCRCGPYSWAIDCDEAIHRCAAYNSPSHFDSCEFELCYSV